MSKRSHNRDDYCKEKRHRYDDSRDTPDLHSIFNGEVASVQPYGVFIKIPGYRKQGLVHKSQMSKARVDDPSEMLATGERVFCKIISIESESMKIGLSMKSVNQTTGEDLDPNNVQLSLDEKRRKTAFTRERPKIELGAVLDTKCARCGGHGHFSQDCYVTKGTKQYDLIPDLDDLERELRSPPSSNATASKEKKKKEKKHKKDKKKKKKHRHSVSSDRSDSEKDSKHTHKHKKSHRKER